MVTVTTLEQIEENIAELERGRADEGKELRKYRALIRRGICFWLYQSQMGFSLAPSRFVGYIDNKLAIHVDNPNIDGRIANAAINRLPGVRFIGNTDLEHTDFDQAYKEFCGTMEVIPTKRGSYWITTKVSEFLGKSELLGRRADACTLL